MSEIDELIKKYHIDHDYNIKQDFTDPDVKHLVDDLFRVVKAYEHADEKDGYDEDYKAGKLKTAMKRLKKIDERL
ncbi:hypothetical protein [Oceanobacillus oncorhynchi]|uniref:hypothetical protein n=1 Tax=Oceanobacillus oncorhynchi TaxID=545501 RepID=UPI001865B971|nr:hypothetical protein [Oceanobacillus oncorhynchi]